MLECWYPCGALVQSVMPLSLTKKMEWTFTSTPDWPNAKPCIFVTRLEDERDPKAVLANNLRAVEEITEQDGASLLAAGAAAGIMAAVGYGLYQAYDNRNKKN